MHVRAPDGRKLTVKGNPWPFMNPWSYIVWAYGEGGGTRFNINAAGSTELIAKLTSEWDNLKVREVSWNGERIQSHEDRASGGTTLLWIGPHNEPVPSSTGPAYRWRPSWTSWPSSISRTRRPD